MEQIEKEVQNIKFNSIQISLQPLLKNLNISLIKLKIALNDFTNVDSKTINIEDAMKYCRPNILEYLLECTNVKDNKQLVEKLKYIGIENNRFDNLFTLFQQFPEINDFIQFDDINLKLVEIEELLEDNISKNFGLENILKKKLNETLNSFNIGLIKLPLNKTYLHHLIIKLKNLWAFQCLKNIYNYDIFFLDDESNTCFDYYQPNKDLDSINFENLQYIINYFDNKVEYILAVIEILTNNLKVINIECNDEFINYLFSILPDKIYITFKNNYNTIFHIVAHLKINSILSKKIMEKLVYMKQRNTKTFQNILNLQNINGNTFLMILLENENYELSIEIFDKFYDYITIHLHNYFGNSLLHILFLNKNFNNISNNFIIFEKIYQLLLKILRRNKTLILSQNREFNISYLLSANSGCNMGLRIMLEFYNIEYLESFCEYSTALHQACINDNINTVRFLIEYVHYNPNIQLKKRGKKSLFKLEEGSTPLHAAAFSSSIEIFEYLLLHGGDPLIQNINKQDAFDFSFKNGNYIFLKYILNLRCSKINSANDKYLLSLVQNTQKDAFQIFTNYIQLNTFANFNTVDEDMNTLLILACRANNTEIISTLINNGISPLIKNKYGSNCLHICAYRNSFSCVGVVLSKLESLNEKNKIKEI